MSQREEIVCDNSTAKKINKLLNSSETRIEGLQLLNLFLRQCPDEEFLQFCISWMQNCCKTDALTKNKDYAAHLLSNLFKISSSHQELKKSVSFFITTRYFDYFFKHLLNSNAGWHCTESCLLYYRGACGSFQNKKIILEVESQMSQNMFIARTASGVILAFLNFQVLIEKVPLETHLKSQLEKNVKISSTMGGCYALIPCIGGGGNDGTNYIKNWKFQFANFLNACNSVLNELLANTEEFQEFETPTTFRNNNKNKTPEDLTIQLTNYSIVLKCMLLNQYPAPKNVPSDLIFQLVCRGLSLNLKALAKQKTHGVVTLENILPEVQCELLSLLKALVVTCKNQLLPYAHLICKLIKQMLEWTDGDFICGSNSPLERLRILAYELLCDWLAVARNGSCVEVISSIVLYNGINDITSKKKVVLLKEKKAEKRLKGKEQTNRQMNAADNGRLCMATLKTFQFLLKYAGVLLKPDEQRFLQGAVVKLITDMQKNSSPDIPVPFDIPACRTELYSLLFELVCQPCSKWPPPANYALRLFREGMNDPCSAVSSVCSAALNFATIIIHPQYDNGAFPINEIMPEEGGRTEVELQCGDREEIMQVDNAQDGVTRQETAAENHQKDGVNTPSIDTSEGTVIPSDEDSRSTGKFDLALVELNKSNVERNKPSGETGEINDEPIAKRQKIETEEKTSPVKEKLNESDPESSEMKKPPEKTCTPVKENGNEIDGSAKETPDSGKVKKTEENTPSPVKELNENGGSSKESSDNEKRKKASERRKTRSKSDSPESVTEESQKARYFLRTKPENTPVSSPTSSQRPRTRALSRGKINSETITKATKKSKDDDVDEEDIKAAFNDFFID